MNIGIIGLSHQGLVYMSFLVKRKLKIIGIDSSKLLIENLKKKYTSKDTLAEPSIQSTLQKHKKNIIFTNDFKKIKKCDFVLITEDVKILSDGTKDENKVSTLIKKAIKNAKINSNFIILSQVRVGFAKKIVTYAKERKKINFLNSPDILTIGQALNDLDQKKTFIVGSEDKDLANNKSINEFFLKIKKKVIFTNLQTVEVAKEAVQLKLGLDVTFVNLLSDFCKYNNAYTQDVIDYMKLDIRFSKKGYWRPGLGFGGGHIERGLKTFDKNLHTHYKDLIQGIIKFNEKRMDGFINYLISNFKNFNNMSIGILGLSYKNNSESVFRSYATRFIQKIKKKRNPIFAYDPAAKFTKNFQNIYNINQVTKLNLVLENSDTLLILCDWDIFKKIKLQDLKKNNIKIVIDPFNIYKTMKDIFLKSNIKYINL